MSDLITDTMVEEATVASINVSLAPYGESITATTDLQGGGEALAEMRAALEAVAPLIAAKALRDFAKFVMGPSPDMHDAATCRSIALDADERARRIERGES